MDRRPWIHPSITDAGEVRNAANGGIVNIDASSNYSENPIAS